MLAQQRPPALVGEVVAFDDADAQSPQALLAREHLEPPRGGARIRCAEITDDRNAMLDAALQHGTDETLEGRLVARVGILPSRELRQRERPLRERLEDQRGGAAARDERRHDRPRSVRSIPGEPRAPADQQHFIRHAPILSFASAPVICDAGRDDRRHPGRRSDRRDARARRGASRGGSRDRSAGCWRPRLARPDGRRPPEAGTACGPPSSAISRTRQLYPSWLP